MYYTFRVQEEKTNTFDTVTQAYQILLNQLYHMIKLDITSLELCEILLSKAEIKSNGVVKMKNAEIVNCVFTMLNEITDLQSMVFLTD